MDKLTGLDLFSGIGGISIALEPWVQTIAYCESDKYAQSVLLSRMRDGTLQSAPIWDDVRTLHDGHLCTPEIGVDIIFGGFPCQDISAAGAGAGLEGKRSGLFYEIVRLTKEIQPTFVFLENVPAIRTRGLKDVVGSFTDLGYDCRWTCISASSVGAPHLRKRWFMLAANTERIDLWNEHGRSGGTIGKDSSLIGNDGAQESLANAAIERREGRGSRGSSKTTSQRSGMHSSGSGQALADTNSQGLEHDCQVYSGSERFAGRDTAAGSGGSNSESYVGGTFDGFSAWLDDNSTRLGKLVGEIVNYAHDQKTRPREVLRILCERASEENLRQSTGRSEYLSSQKILLACLLGIEKGQTDETWLQLARAKVSQEELRSLRLRQKSSCPPRRSKPRKQRGAEHSDPVQTLSQLLAHHAEEAWAFYRRENVPALQSWADGWDDGISRAGAGIVDRVDRLKCLGNSVVPAQVRVAFEILIGG